MTFVYPLLLGGLVLAGLPVLLHFLIRRQPTTLTFPAFRFLMQKERSNTRSLRLRHLLLLLLRIGLVVLVCIALARLRVFHETLGLSREKPAAIVLIFDTSPSMDYKVGGATRLDLAKKRALELLDQLPEDGRTLILDACDPDSFASAEWLKSLEKARQRIQALTIQPRSEPTTKAIDEGLRRFAEWDGPRGDSDAALLPRFLCVFSDRTTGSWDSPSSAGTSTSASTTRSIWPSPAPTSPRAAPRSPPAKRFPCASPSSPRAKRCAIYSLCRSTARKPQGRRSNSNPAGSKHSRSITNRPSSTPAFIRWKYASPRPMTPSRSTTSGMRHSTLSKNNPCSCWRTTSQERSRSPIGCERYSTTSLTKTCATPAPWLATRRCS
ncbi:MAG: BatA domain-containing protein [Planctomycetes bacterium]|nr:BatA domain-containing protein [Planctomycetota bacterium]